MRGFGDRVRVIVRWVVVVAATGAGARGFGATAFEGGTATGFAAAATVFAATLFLLIVLSRFRGRSIATRGTIFGGVETRKPRMSTHLPQSM